MIGDEGELKLDFDDDIIKGACITHEGEIVHEGARNAVGGPAQPDRSGGAGGDAPQSERGTGGPAEVT
jgi:NAD(P) transhydrogenase subunit alpha